MTTAQAILAQLGGNRFLAMTGAKDLISSATGLTMRLPKARNRATHIRVTLTPNDLYTVTTLRCTVKEHRTIETAAEIGCEQLPAAFERLTGLMTRL